MNEEEKEMLELMKRGEQVQIAREQREAAHLGLTLKMIDLQERRLKVMEEMLAEIRLLRVTGIQP